MRYGLLLLLLLLAACGPRDASSGNLVIVDDAGDTVRFAHPVERVVSLSPATTELLFALGAGHRVVGRTRWCDYPAAALAVANVGDGIPPNLEAVLAQTPDLVLLYQSPQNQPAADHFRAAGVPTLMLTMDHLADVPRLARLLGPLVAAREAGDSLARVFDSTLAAVSVPALPADAPEVLLLAWDQPPIVIGRGSFQSEILARAGGRNVFEDIASPSAPVSIEAMVARDPDLILVSDSGLPSISQRAGWKVIPAVREQRFLHFGSPAFGRPSPRAPELVYQLRLLLADQGP